MMLLVELSLGLDVFVQLLEVKLLLLSLLLKLLLLFP